MGNVILHEIELPKGITVCDVVKCLYLYPLWVQGSQMAEAALKILGARLFIGTVQIENGENENGKR